MPDYLPTYLPGCRFRKVVEQSKLLRARSEAVRRQSLSICERSRTDVFISEALLIHDDLERSSGEAAGEP